MVTENQIQNYPSTFAEFLLWEPEDGYKYEWNDGELICFTGMNKKKVYIYDYINRSFIAKQYLELGSLVSEYDVQLSGIQMRRPDIAYLTKEQITETKKGVDVIPEFVIEILSETDNINRVEEKVTEYFKAGVKVIWHIFPELKMIYVYTSRRDVKICIENDICSASPVLTDFETVVSELFA
ncbi:Uma2 family endonuclease [Arcicella aurantiaca]|uniref:Uma2 family endonuclease n=1 Tax=Arcicella aurantiaca TaxID=591202 RepID=A0A316EGS1_9BACT|nr:Uma2 family endonuclease [Arcicella aurantiaca]PWK27937.1 Uma2 family endonuclease [Arcicella aurantiaca]